jgi:hypothetical protein
LLVTSALAFCVRLNLAATSSQSRDSHRNDAAAAALLDHQEISHHGEDHALNKVRDAISDVRNRNASNRY